MPPNDTHERDERFLALVNENRARILKICRVYASNPSDHEDLYQEILMQIWRSFGSLQEAAHADTWLYRVALNTGISFLRKRTAAHAKSTLSLAPDQIRELADKQPADSQENSQALAVLYEAISKLDAVERALITLFLEDLSYEQIAEVLGTTTSNIGVMLHRAKKKLAALTQEVAP